MVWIMLFLLGEMFFLHLNNISLLILISLLCLFTKYSGRLIFLLLLLEVFTIYFLMLYFSISQLSVGSMSMLYIILSAVVIEASLGFGLLIRLIRSRTKINHFM